MERAMNALVGHRVVKADIHRGLLAAIAAVLALVATGALVLATHGGTTAGGATARAASPLDEGYGPAYWSIASAGGALAASPSQQLAEHFKAGGVTVHRGGATVGLRLRSLSAGGRTTAIAATRPHT